jgi:hypothetical protein
MSTIAINNTEWIYRLMASQSNQAKLDMINRLSAALMKKSKAKKADMSFFDGLTNAWDDNVTAEEEVKRIYAARTTGETRKLVDF